MQEKKTKTTKQPDKKQQKKTCLVELTATQGGSNYECPVRKDKVMRPL